MLSSPQATPGSAAYQRAWRIANPARTAAHQRAYRMAHLEKRAAAGAAYYASHREKAKAYYAARYVANVEAAKTRSAAYYAANPEKVKSANAAWTKANPEARRARDAARRARKLGAPGTATVAEIAARWTYHENKCWMCGGEATCTDHVKPLVKGGSNWPANLRPACGPCNSSKGTTWPFAVAA